MAVALLRNLGVDQTIIEALVKSYGAELQGLEISKEDVDLKLIVKDPDKEERTSHVLTLSKFFGERALKVAEEGAVYRRQCRDRFEFLTNDGSDKENLCVNGVGMKLSDSLYSLFLCLAHAVQDTENGWVYIQDLKEKGIIPSDGYQPFSRLRMALAGYLLEKNPHDVIESNGRKQYRLSVDPDNILIPEGIKQ